MRHTAKYILFAFALLMSVACGSKSARQGQERAAQSEDIQVQTRPLKGYWADYGPTALLDDVEGAERRFKEWCALLKSADAESQKGAVAEFVELMVADEVCYHVWSEWARMYLYGVWSPVRNAQALDMLLHSIESDRRVPADGKDFVPRLLGMISHNRVGDMAEEFDMYDPRGERHTLEEFRGQRVLLLVVDTSCPSCVDTMEEIEADRSIMEAARRGDLALVVVSINQTSESVATLAEEKEGTLWRVYCASGSHLEAHYYDIEAAPMLYMLSHEGRVEVDMTRDIERLAEVVKR